MEWLRIHFPVLFSPKFWGIVITATLIWFREKGFLDESTITWLATISGGATGVGILDSIARKIGSTKG